MTEMAALNRFSESRGGGAACSEGGTRRRLSPANGFTEEDLTHYGQVGRRPPTHTLREPLPA